MLSIAGTWSSLWALTMHGGCSAWSRSSDGFPCELTLACHWQLRRCRWLPRSAWPTVQRVATAGWRSPTMAPGQPCVMRAGVWLKLEWRAGSWAVGQRCQHPADRILGKDLGKCGLTAWAAWARRLPSLHARRSPGTTALVTMGEKLAWCAQVTPSGETQHKKYGGLGPSPWFSTSTSSPGQCAPLRGCFHHGVSWGVLRELEKFWLSFWRGQCQFQWVGCCHGAACRLLPLSQQARWSASTFSWRLAEPAALGAALSDLRRWQGSFPYPGVAACQLFPIFPSFR